MTNIFEKASPDVVSTTEKIKSQIIKQIDASVEEAMNSGGY
jgi:hypothetical protein